MTTPVTQELKVYEVPRKNLEEKKNTWQTAMYGLHNTLYFTSKRESGCTYAAIAGGPSSLH